MQEGGLENTSGTLIDIFNILWAEGGGHPDVYSRENIVFLCRFVKRCVGHPRTPKKIIPQSPLPILCSEY